MSEKFNPINPKYKKVEDLPSDQRDNYVQKEEGGFITKEVAKADARHGEITENWNKKRSLFNRVLGRKASQIEVAREYAIEENQEYDKKEEEKRQEEEIDRKREEKRIAEIKKTDDYLEKEEHNIVSLIKEEEMAGLQKVASGLGKNFSGRDYDQVEDLVGCLFNSQKRTERPYKEILDAAATLFTIIDKDSFRGWSHAVCHHFEKYGQYYSEDGTEYSDIGRLAVGSFLNEPSGAVVELIDESVERSIENESIGSVNRIVGPLVKYNLDHMNLNNLDEPFSFKPESLNNKEFSSLLSKNDHDKLAEVFCVAESPREFLVQCVKSGVELGYKSKLEKVGKFLLAVKNDVGEEEMNAYINKFYPVNSQDINIETLVGNLTEADNASERMEGVYVDVEGTLIRDGELNNDLVGMLEGESASGKKIIVFSGGSTEALTKRLQELGLPEKFLPVLSKNDFKGKILETLIDDTIPAYQGFKAEQYQNPS